MIFPSCQICFHLPITFSTWAGCLGYHRGWNPTQLWWGLKQKMMNHDKDPGLNNRYSWKQPGLRFFFSNFVAHLRNRRSNPTVSGWPLGINVFSAPFRMLKRDQAPAARVTRFHLSIRKPSKEYQQIHPWKQTHDPMSPVKSSSYEEGPQNGECNISCC